jgi:hypothetical protein
MDGNPKGIAALLEKQGRSKPSAITPAVAEPDGENESTAFANGRVGTHPQLSIIFRKADGSVTGFAYAHLYSVKTSNEAEGFVAEFTQTKVAVKGRNLELLFRFICQHRAAEVTEAERHQVFEQGLEAPVVEKIDFVPLGTT